MSNPNTADERGFMLIEVVIVIVILALIALIPITRKVRCEAKWSDSGLHSKWGWWSGCLISKDGKRFIPEERYREIEGE